MPIYYKDYANANINYVNDIIENDMSFKTHNDIRKTVGQSANFLNYASLCNSVKLYASNIQINISETKNKLISCPFIPFHINILLNEQKGCKMFFVWNNLVML